MSYSFCINHSVMFSCYSHCASICLLPLADFFHDCFSHIDLIIPRQFSFSFDPTEPFDVFRQWNAYLQSTSFPSCEHSWYQLVYTLSSGSAKPFLSSTPLDLDNLSTLDADKPNNKPPAHTSPIPCSAFIPTLSCSVSSRMLFRLPLSQVVSQCCRLYIFSHCHNNNQGVSL